MKSVIKWQPLDLSAPYIAHPCKTCKQPIGTAEHYHDSSGYEHKACLKKRAMRKV